MVPQALNPLSTPTPTTLPPTESRNPRGRLSSRNYMPLWLFVLRRSNVRLFHLRGLAQPEALPLFPTDRTGIHYLAWCRLRFGELEDQSHGPRVGRTPETANTANRNDTETGRQRTRVTTNVTMLTSSMLTFQGIIIGRTELIESVCVLFIEVSETGKFVQKQY